MNQELERALHEALAHKNPPAGFADRVMARLPESAPLASAGSVRAMPMRRRPWLAVGLAAGLAAMGTFAGARYQQYRQGQEASRQLMLALHIAGEKLTLAQHKVVGIGERRIDQ